MSRVAHWIDPCQQKQLSKVSKARLTWLIRGMRQRSGEWKMLGNCWVKEKIIGANSNIHADSSLLDGHQGLPPTTNKQPSISVRLKAMSQLQVLHHMQAALRLPLVAARGTDSFSSQWAHRLQVFSLEQEVVACKFCQPGSLLERSLLLHQP